MKGIVFVKFSEFVEEAFGEAFWDELLAEADLPSQGAYTSVANYDDNELFQLVGLISQKKSITPEDAQRAFGNWIFEHLIALVPEHTESIKSTFQFLHSVQNIIHVEVKKLTPDAILPQFTFLDESANHLSMRYESPRHLCYFCEGLIQSLGKHTGENIEVSQSQCVHEGGEECIIEVKKVD